LPDDPRLCLVCPKRAYGGNHGAYRHGKRRYHSAYDHRSAADGDVRSTNHHESANSAAEHRVSFAGGETCDPEYDGVPSASVANAIVLPGADARHAGALPIARDERDESSPHRVPNRRDRGSRCGR
jgi:hypothetical protein